MVPRETCLVTNNNVEKRAGHRDDAKLLPTRQIRIRIWRSKQALADYAAEGKLF